MKFTPDLVDALLDQCGRKAAAVRKGVHLRLCDGLSNRKAASEVGRDIAEISRATSAVVKKAEEISRISEIINRGV